MGLGTLIIAIAVVGLLLYLVNKYVPMDARIKMILNVVVIIVLVIWLVVQFGVIDYAKRIRLG